MDDTINKQVLSSDDVFTTIVGLHHVKKELKSALLSRRHIIIQGPPGVGKTTLSKNVAQILGKNTPFIRVQGSPDLTVEDLLGDIDPIKAMKHGPLSVEAFTKGKIFKADKGVLFFDEINRCPEKVQNALLQVLEEGQATIGSYDVDFDLNFFFIATMNPEDTSTEKLSDVLLDRFDVIDMGYPDTLEDEKKIVSEKGGKLCQVGEKLATLMVYFVRLLRQNEKLEKKPSVRASLGLYERSQANALLHKRDVVEFDDVKDAVISVISHRIRLKPSSKYLVTPQEFVKEEFERSVEQEEWEKELEMEQGKGDGL